MSCIVIILFLAKNFQLKKLPAIAVSCAYVLRATFTFQFTTLPLRQCEFVNKPPLSRKVRTSHFMVMPLYTIFEYVLIYII